MGVWIEIVLISGLSSNLIPSLPAWECGLKLAYRLKTMISDVVTPCMGVWIEILPDHYQ